MDVCEGGADKLEGGEKRDIRRPMNAFLIFCKRHRSMVREKHPERDNRSVTRILGDLWANLAMEEKVIYTNLAKQYKDAFMKANPDYKWHSSEKLPQPAKMSTRPTNTRVLGSSSGAEGPPQGSIVSGQLADPDKMGGLSLLLMAGQHSMAGRERSSPASVLERRMTSPDLSSSNSALLQLAEMCSTELHGKRPDTSILRCAPPKKRARHWSYSDCGQTDLPEQKSPFLLKGESLSATVLDCPSKKSSLELACSEDVQVSKKHSLDIPCSEDTEVKASSYRACLLFGSICDDATCPSCNRAISPCLQKHIDGKLKPMHPVSPLKAGSAREGLTCRGIDNTNECDEERDMQQVRPGQQSAGASACLLPNHDQGVARALLADIGMPPKKKFTKLQVSQQKEKINWQRSGLGVTQTQGLQYKESWKGQEEHPLTFA
ncbi:hypothetical protein C0Q70_12642 [Pomacea canaliculata]|uniref:HMG box domain-containing protein n=1 Tax=Pomacea canaliculata TaxID=400727 RepID=A0A2T7P237_POMCA|nr:uncharacterized protein LOC112567679 [Pomacea canaliculata]XP_025100203.1 uncharacterized protein LOC112567679 [Pomacea canaliculata]XP_025100204.1 uncharacterized protein LOC112567679 [Pomacea canaliculata]XP_025100205.1 uncharacterized protein LOC112567679 [Pomacea canaliculata]PVD27481.1 hypothetical protein C0Q70_12642 [Pomacea canaliculata]